MRKIILIIFSILLLFSCQNKKQETIKIGAIFSMTGNVGAYGQRSNKGFLTAVDKINSEDGINGKYVTAIVEDAGSDSKKALSAFNKLVNVDKVNVIIGDVLSSTTMAIVPLLEKENVLLFAPGASHPDLKGASSLFFRNWTPDDFDGAAMARYILSEGKREVSVLVQNSDYTLGLSNAFKSEFENLGGLVTVIEQFETNMNNARSQLINLKEQNTNNIFLIGQSRENGIILKQSKEMNFNPNWYANLTVETPECLEIAGSAANDVVFSTPAFDIDSENDNVLEFKKLFTNKYDEEPEATVGHAYDAVLIVAEAMKNEVETPMGIANSIKNISNFPGVTGITSFTSDGDVVKNVFIKKIENGKSKLIKEFNFYENASIE